MVSTADIGLSNIVYTLLAGFLLFIFSIICRRITRSSISPAFVFSVTWGVALIFLSITPYMGFYSIKSNALLIFVFGAILFSSSSIVFSAVFRKAFRPCGLSGGQIGLLDFKKLLLLFLVVSAFIVPLIVNSILEFGSTLPEIAYKLRATSITGERVIPGYLAIYFVFAIFVSVLLIYAVVNKKLKAIHVFLSLMPFLIITLILNGRSGLISLILSWIFVYLFCGGKLNIKVVALFGVSAGSVIFFGAVLVNKVEVSDAGVWDSTYYIIAHIVDYLFQGPVLFSRYFENEINVRENWDTLNIVCHIFSKLDLCIPMPQHQDIATYGINKLGNVYTFYFAVFPRYSYVGLLFFIILYS